MLLKALRDACMNRTTGVTSLNEWSSRSHFIVTIYINAFDTSRNKALRGKLSLVDLAGSERLGKTKGYKTHMNETNKINLSLATLSKVFLGLKNNDNHIAYRDSKLTHFLKEQLGG